MNNNNKAFLECVVGKLITSHHQYCRYIPYSKAKNDKYVHSSYENINFFPITFSYNKFNAPYFTLGILVYTINCIYFTNRKHDTCAVRSVTKHFVFFFILFDVGNTTHTHYSIIPYLRLGIARTVERVYHDIILLLLHYYVYTSSHTQFRKHYFIRKRLLHS